MSKDMICIGCNCEFYETFCNKSNSKIHSLCNTVEAMSADAGGKGEKTFDITLTLDDAKVVASALREFCKGKTMNPICKTCDTRIRLRRCNGKNGDFKYCMRKVGSINGLEESIVQFNTFEDIKKNLNSYTDGFIFDSLWLDDTTDYDAAGTMTLLWGKWRSCPDMVEYPIGYVTKLATHPEKVYFGDENDFAL